MRKTKLKVCSILGALIVLITGCSKHGALIDLEQAKATTSADNPNVEISNKDIYSWIGRYPDNARLADLFLFGSHDAGTFKLKDLNDEVAKCQSLDFENQLKWGVRVFDCRLSENMNFFHGKIYCATNLQDFASACISFLRNNPKEFVVAMIKAENAEGPGDVYNSNFQKIVNELGREHFLFEKDLLNQPISRLRGKIVVVTRGYNKGESGYIEGAPRINWPDDTTKNPTSEANGCLRVGISDRYTAYPETKAKTVKEVFPDILPTREKDPTRWFIFFTSGYDYSGAVWPCPYEYMCKFRVAGKDVMKERIHYLKKGGTLMMDFVGGWNSFRDFSFEQLVPVPKSELD